MSISSDDEFGILAHEIIKNSRTSIRFSLAEFHGYKYIDIREYFSEDGHVWKPTKKGVTLSLDDYEELADAVIEIGNLIGNEGD